MRKSYCENFTRFQCVVLEKTELKLSTVFLYRNDLRKGIIYIYIYIYNIYIYIFTSYVWVSCKSSKTESLKVWKKWKYNL